MKKLVILMLCVVVFGLYAQEDSKWTIYNCPSSDYTTQFINEDPAIGNFIKSSPAGGISMHNDAGEMVDRITADNLPHGNVRYVEFDHLGMWWIATQGGLTRYNPTDKTFQNFPVGDGFLPSENIHTLKFDSQRKQMLVGTSEGLAIYTGDFSFEVPYSPLTGDWEVYFSELIESNSIKSVGIDGAGNIWAINTMRAFKINNNQWIEYNDTNSIIDNPSNIVIDNNGNAWISCGSFLAMYNGSSFEKKVDGISSAHIEIDKDNTLWCMEIDFLTSVDLDAQLAVSKEDKDNYDWLLKGKCNVFGLNQAGNLLVAGYKKIAEHKKVVPIITSFNQIKQTLPIAIKANRLVVSVPSNYTISLFNANGKKIVEIYKYYAAGYYKLPFASLSGAHIVRIQNKENSFVQKLILTK